MPDDAATGGGKLNLFATITNQYANAEFLLKRGDSLADGGLRHV